LQNVSTRSTSQRRLTQPDNSLLCMCRPSPHTRQLLLPCQLAQADRSAPQHCSTNPEAPQGRRVRSLSCALLLHGPSVRAVQAWALPRPTTAGARHAMQQQRARPQQSWMRPQHNNAVDCQPQCIEISTALQLQPVGSGLQTCCWGPGSGGGAPNNRTLGWQQGWQANTPGSA
jgi:hypothetical protein